MSIRKVLMPILCLCLTVTSVFAAENVTDTKSTMEIEQKIVNTETININTASAEEIASKLKGIGEKKARAIVEYRENHGDFTNLNDVLGVKGIGAATLEKNKEKILL